MFTERLKTLRKEAGLTQKDMAEKFSTSQPSYQQWESGKRTPNSDSLDKLANFFNVSTDYLLGNTDYKNSLEQDIEEAIQRSVAYDGKPITDNDKKIITDFLKDYFAKKGD
ncbi:helix-turn-helix domain-containing protein [Streptococcus entericus]|uniref:helix-turn-helix domain-containing protein n=1 Tax=Streptococcus entericus TaxID=155680 RepID=UPI0004770C82|nr:helix-turn-helix transcriptional regulator [Streptococcus entericus]